VLSVSIYKQGGFPVKEINGVRMNERSEVILNLDDLSDGLYLVKIKGGSHPSTQRLIIKR
jgi:hypothetical protein